MTPRVAKVLISIAGLLGAVGSAVRPNGWSIIATACAIALILVCYERWGKA